VAIAKCSPDTALRDINDLLARGVLRKADAGGRSTRHERPDPGAFLRYGNKHRRLIMGPKFVGKPQGLTTILDRSAPARFSAYRGI
jgi:hypothetical protein